MIIVYHAVSSIVYVVTFLALLFFSLVVQAANFVTEISPLFHCLVFKKKTPKLFGAYRSTEIYLFNSINRPVEYNPV
jgi:hypothetical protein